MGGANAFLKDYSSNQNANLGNRAFGKELTNYGRADSNVDQLKSYVKELSIC